MEKIITNCTLRYDQPRGVLYVDAPTGQTVLRIHGVKQDLTYSMSKEGIMSDNPEQHKIYSLIDLRINDENR